MKASREPAQFAPITLILESDAEAQLLLGLLRLDRDPISGTIDPTGLTGAKHLYHMAKGKGADDTAMYSALEMAYSENR